MSDHGEIEVLLRKNVDARQRIYDRLVEYHGEGSVREASVDLAEVALNEAKIKLLEETMNR